MFSIEVVRKNRPAKPSKVILFDFDGTVSQITQGWRESMVQYFVEQIVATPKGKDKPREELERHLGSMVDENTGKPTILVMQRFAREIAAHGQDPMPPEEYYRNYGTIVNPVMKARIDGLLDGTISREEMLVPGVLDLLELLRQKGLRICLASGSHRDFVLKECDALRITEYFDAGIYGATRGDDSFKKSDVIKELIERYEIDSAELLGFGDGHAETLFVREAGGFAVGVATEEILRRGVNQHKRNVLIRAGADLIIPDYSDIESIQRQLFA